MSKVITLVALTALIASTTAAALQSTSSSSNPIASTPFGAVSGFIDQGVMSFRGIPYSVPPVGGLRFAPPSMAKAWPGTLDGTKFSPGCMATCPNTSFPQPALMCTQTVSEDCLYLNVYTPTLNTTANLPVVLFIHGGNYIAGSGGVPLYDGSDLSRNENVVVVTINYRLGVLGGLYTGTVKGNFQTMDQRLAMQFTQRIASSFGGNPNLVTLSGQSAGAFSVATHLTSPKSWPYFQRAIIMSDPTSLLAGTPNISTTLGNEILHTIGCSGTTGERQLSCLRAVPAERFLEAQNDKYKKVDLMLMDMMEYVPVVDGDELPYQPQYAMSKGLVHKVPIFFGTVANESVQFIYDISPKPLPAIGYAAFFELIFGLVYGTEALDLYGPVPADKKTDARLFMSIPATDYIFYCVNRMVGTGLTAVTPTYMWFFDIAASWNQWAFGSTMPYCVHNVCHASDLPFVFNPFKAPLPINETMPQPTPEEANLIVLIQRAWGNFARSGNPNPLPNGVVLDRFDPARNNLLNISIPTTVINNYRDEYCDFWDKAGYNRT